MVFTKVDNGVTISSPWHNVNEAAAHCRMTRQTFAKKRGNLPYGGTDKHKLYHQDVLDRFIRTLRESKNDEDVQQVGPAEAARPMQMPPRVRRRKHDEKVGVYDPGTRRIYAPVVPTGA